MKNFHLKILIAGEGGQGVQTIGQILSAAAFEDGFQSIYIPNYGVEQRGGVSLGYLQISDFPIPYPKFKIAHILVVLCERAIPRIKNYYDKKTKLINGIGFIYKPEEYNFAPRTFNMLILGILSDFVPVKKETLLKAIEKKFKKLPAEIIRENKQVFSLGRGLGLNLPAWANELKPLSIKDHRKWPPDIKAAAGKSKFKITHIIHRKLCKSCGICIVRCPTKALHFSKEMTGIYGTPITEVNISKCIGCGLCERVCPDTAIEVKKGKV